MSHYLSQHADVQFGLQVTRFSALARTLFYLPPHPFWLAYDPAQNQLFFSLLMIRLEVFRLGEDFQTAQPQTSPSITSFSFLFSITPQRSFMNVMNRIWTP